MSASVVLYIVEASWYHPQHWKNAALRLRRVTHFAGVACGYGLPDNSGMPFLRSFTISGSRAYGAQQQVTFAVPDAEKPGSGLTILVGPNGGGKSTLLEAIQATCLGLNTNVDRMHRNPETNYEVLFSANWVDGASTTLRSMPENPGNLVLKEASKTNKSRAVYFLPARRSLPDQVANQAIQRDEFIRTATPQVVAGMGPLVSRESAGHGGFHGRLREICRNRAAFNTVWKELTDIDLRISTDANDVFVTVNGSHHRPSGLGAGIVSLIHITDSLYDARDGETVLIDEPEVSLHPDLQKRLLRHLIAASQRVQIVYATHSPYMIDWGAICSGATLARVHRDSSGLSRIAQLRPETAELTRGLSKDLNNPHVLGTTSKEVFFLPDKIILVEGQEDVMFYRHIARQLDLKSSGEFYGWGVGGAEKMGKISAVLRDLGYQNVVGILDADKKSLAEQLHSQFSYSYLCIPTNDVRDKEKPNGACQGLCQRDGTIRPEHVASIVELFAQAEARFKA